MRLLVALLVGLLCTSTQAEYSDSCGLYAQMLWSAADEYESEESQFKSACDPYYGYSKDDESACGAYGYQRSGFKRAQESLEDALNNVALFCGTCDHLFRSARQTTSKETVALKKEVAALEAKVKKLEADNEAHRKAAAGEPKTTK